MRKSNPYKNIYKIPQHHKDARNIELAKNAMQSMFQREMQTLRQSSSSNHTQ